jgi:hypothetical protein
MSLEEVDLGEKNSLLRYLNDILTPEEFTLILHDAKRIILFAEYEKFGDIRFDDFALDLSKYEKNFKEIFYDLYIVNSYHGRENPFSMERIYMSDDCFFTFSFATEFENGDSRLGYLYTDDHVKFLRDVIVHHKKDMSDQDIIDLHTADDAEFLLKVFDKEKARKYYMENAMRKFDLALGKQ